MFYKSQSIISVILHDQVTSIGYEGTTFANLPVNTSLNEESCNMPKYEDLNIFCGPGEECANDFFDWNKFINFGEFMIFHAAIY